MAHEFEFYGLVLPRPFALEGRRMPAERGPGVAEPELPVPGF